MLILSNFVPPVWKLHNPYCHNRRQSKWSRPRTYTLLSIARLYWKTNLLLTQVVQKVFPDHWLWLKFDQFLKKIVGFAFTLNIHNYIVILANSITFFKHGKSNGNDRLLHFPNWLNFIFLSNDMWWKKIRCSDFKINIKIHTTCVVTYSG